jgi:hypothetical protein
MVTGALMSVCSTREAVTITVSSYVTGFCSSTGFSAGYCLLGWSVGRCACWP